LTAGATPVWLLGSFAVLSLLYRAEVSADQHSASTDLQDPSAEVLTKRAQAKRAYAELSADGAPVSAGQLAAAAGLSACGRRIRVARSVLELAPILCGAAPSRSSPRTTEPVDAVRVNA
jgi:hypothetical protein